MDRRRFLALAGTAPFVAGAVGPAAAQQAKNTLRLAWGNSFENFDPYYGATREGLILSRHVYDTLLHRDPDTGEYKPLLATSYRWVDDVTLELELRRDVRFHDGSPFSADDVADTFNRVVKPDSGIKVRSIVEWLKSAEKLGDHKVRLHLNAPYPMAPELLSSQLGIHSAAYFAKVGRDAAVREPVGTGPYRVVAQEIGKSARLQRFEGYMTGGPKGTPQIETLEIRIIPEPMTQMAELMTGAVDWIWRVSPDLMGRLAAVPTIKTDSAETMRYTALVFDAAGRAGKSPVQDPRVRRAFAHAINRQSIRDNLVKGKARVLDSLCFPSQFGCTNEVAKYAYDPALAKKLLAEAGYPDGFEMTMVSYVERVQTDAVAADLAKVGIRVKARPLQSPVVRKMMADNEVQLAFVSWGSFSVNDVSAAISMYFDFGGFDLTRDAQLRDWIKTADTSTVPATRQANYKSALQRIAEEAYWIPLTTTVTNYAYAKALQFEAPYDEVPTFFDARWS